LLVVFVQSIYPITASNSILSMVIYQTFYASLMIAGVFVVRDNPIYVKVLVVLGLAWMIAGFVFALNPDATWAILITYAVVGTFQAMVVYVLLHYVFDATRVNRDVIYAACAAYFLIGGVFVPIYGSIETVTFAIEGSHAFADGGVTTDGVVPWQTFIYYSYSTLTTLGYGDILPVTMVARSAAALEAMIGVLYMAIIIARLVSLYNAEGGES